MMQHERVALRERGMRPSCIQRVLVNDKATSQPWTLPRTSHVENLGCLNIPAMRDFTNDPRIVILVFCLFCIGFGLRSLHRTGNGSNAAILASNQRPIHTSDASPAAASAPIYIYAPTSQLQDSKVAAIIEDRPLANLVPLILHFAAVLGPTWPIRVFHAQSNAHLFVRSAAFGQHVASGRINTTMLGPEVSFASHQDVSRFLAATTSFWDALAPAEHVLLFQADSVLCANSPQRVEDFMQWDLVGAPIASQYGVGYNGGLSLRNRSAMIHTIQHNVWAGDFEDQWFFARLKEAGARLPTPEEAMRFGVETIWHDEPLGVHQVQRWQKEQLEELATWCPEYRLADEGTLYKPQG